MERGIREYKDGVIMRHDEIPTLYGTSIGRPMEKVNTRWGKLEQLQHKDTKRFEDLRVYNEIVRFTGNLRISTMYNSFIFKKYNKFYSKLETGTNSRGYRALVPVTVFIVLKENFIFRRPSDIFNMMECKKTQFNKTLQEVYRNNPLIYKKFKSNPFRKKYILQTLQALSAHFKFRPEFMNLAKEYVKEYFLDFKNKMDTIIVAIIYAQCKEALNNNLSSTANQVCLFLGKRSSVLTVNKKLWSKSTTSS